MAGAAPTWTTPRLRLRAATCADAAALLAYRLHNREHLRPWEPARDASFFTLAACAQTLTQQTTDMAGGHALHLLLARQETPAAIIGQCHFTQIVRGPFQACYLGFSLDAAVQGQGLMREALTAALAHVFGELKLHRVMAGYQPDNQRSARLLAALGFEKEGLARRYLCIDGVWSDHVLTALLHPDARTGWQ